MFFKQKNKYEYYMDQAKNCEDFALACTAVGDKDLATFYRNAAEGFKIKALNLKLKDA